MKILRLLVICLLFYGCAASLQNVDISLTMPNGFNDNMFDAKKVRVAVLDFEIPKDISNIVTVNPSDRLVTALVKSKKFDVIERKKLKQILTEQKIGMSGLLDTNTAAEIGRLLGAQYMIFGTVTGVTQMAIDKFSYFLYETKVEIDVRAVDTTTGQIVISEKAAGKMYDKTVYSASGELISGANSYPKSYLDAMMKAVEQLSVKIANLSPTIGYIVAINGDIVTTDLGQESGVSVGQKYMVFRKGKDILHPQTGKRLGFDKEVLAVVEIQNCEANMAIGKVLKNKVDKDGKNVPINPGDMLILITQ